MQIYPILEFASSKGNTERGKSPMLKKSITQKFRQSVMSNDLKKNISYATLDLDPLTGGPTNMNKRVQMRKSMKITEPPLTTRSQSVSKHKLIYVPVEKA
jgi:hypothetical protein